MMALISGVKRKRERKKKKREREMGGKEMGEVQELGSLGSLYYVVLHLALKVSQ